MSASSTTATTGGNTQNDYHPLNNHHQHLNRLKSNSSNSINNSINNGINNSSAAVNGSVSNNKLRSPVIADNNIGVGAPEQHHMHQHQPHQQKALTNGMFMANSFRHPHQHHIHHRGNNNSSISSSSSSLNMRKSYPSGDPSNASFSSASVAGSIQDDNMSDQCGLTQAGLEEYNSRSYYDQPVFHHQKQSSYAQSEGYHSYVSSSDSSSATPFLDRLRQETELLSRQSHHWSQNDLSPSASTNSPNLANATIDNNSNESTSSTETLKWLGSMSDVSVASHATNSSAISGSVSSSSQLIVHSSRVLSPKRHNSESVLYMNDDQMSVTSDTNAITCNKTPNLYQQQHHQHQHQHYHPPVSGHKTSGVDHQNRSSISPSSGVAATVPSSGSPSSSASPTSISPSTIATTTSTAGSSYRSNHRLFPVSTYTEPVNGNATDYQHHHQYQPQTAQPQQHNQQMTPMKLSSPQSHNWQSVADRISDFERQQHLSAHHHHGLQQQQQQQQQPQQQQQQQQQQPHSVQKYTYIDPSKTHRVPNPTLKAFQKNAVQSYFERQQHNAKENIHRNQPLSSSATAAINQNRPQSLQLASAPKEVVIPHMRSSLPNNYAGPNFSHKSPSAQQIINNSLLMSPISDDSSPYIDCNSGIPPPPPPRSRSLMPIRRSSSASEYAEFRESFIRAKDKPNLNMITSPEKISFNDCGVPPPPPPPRGGRNPMPVRRTSSASEYVAVREKNIKIRQNLAKELLGPLIMGPIISVDDWVPERPPKNPLLRIPSPDLPPPPLQTIDHDSNLLNQDEPLPPPPPEILRHMRQSSDGEIKAPSPSRRNSFAGSPSRKTLYRASTFENLSPPSVPKKPSSIDLMQPRPSSSMAQSHKAHKVILNGKLESPTSPNCPRSPSTPQPPELMARASDPRASVRKRSHNSYPSQPLSAESLSPGKVNAISVKSPPPLKPRMPIAGQEMRASSVAISSKLRRNSKAQYLPRQTRDKLNTTDPDHGSYKLTLTSNEDSINHSTQSFHEDILSSKCNNLPDVLPVGVKMQPSSPSSSSSSPRYGSNNNINMVTPPHTAPPLLSNSYPMKSMFHFQSPSPAINHNRLTSSPISTSPPSYSMAALNRSTSSPMNSNDSISPKYMSQSTIDLKKTHVFDSIEDHHQHHNKMMLSPAQSESNVCNQQDKPRSPYSAKHEFRKMEVARKLSLEEQEKCEGRIVRAELVKTTLSASPPTKSDEKVIRKDSLRGNIEKITQLQSKLMSAHLIENAGERTLLGYTAKTVEIKSKVIEKDTLRVEPKSPTPRNSPATSPLFEINESERISRMDSEIDGLKLMQRTEIILRLNAPTTEAASQTDETLENELTRIKLSDASKDATTIGDDKIESKIVPIELTPRKKHPEEIDCDNLAKDLISYLAPSDKLVQILEPKIFKSTADYVTGLYNPKVAPRPNKRDVGTSTPDHKSDRSIGCEINKSPSAEALEATTNYYGAIEPKILTRYCQEMSLLNGDSGDLTKKKEELVNRLTKKLTVLGHEQTIIAEESSTNDQLGSDLAAKVSDKLRPIDATKFRAYIDDVGHITMLLLSLSGRLAKVENALYNNIENSAEKKILEVKRDRLLEQLEEAKRLKEDIDRRGSIVGKILEKSLAVDEYADYDYFINIKAKLIVDSRENSDKIKLGEEQLKALKDTLIQSEC